MPLTSALLRKQIGQVFGEADPSDLGAVLAAAQRQGPEVFVKNIRRLLETVDAAYGAYAGLQRSQGQLSGDTYADWNLITGRIDSGFQWKKLLGYETNALDNQIGSWQKLLHAEDLQTLQKQIAEHVAKRTPHFEVACRMRNKAGEWQWQLVRGQVTARSEAGEPSRLIVLQRDASDLKGLESERDEAQQQLVACEARRKEFLANVGHEIRTPINGILGMTELALDTTLTDEQRQYLRTVKTSAEGLVAVVNDLMDFSKLETGQLTLVSQEFSPVGLLVDVAKGRSMAARRKGLELVIDITPGLPERVAGDPDRLRQVVDNLLENAIKFTTAGEIGMTARLAEQNGGAVWLEVVVRDTGIGIPADRQQAIFEGFSQADGSVTRAFGGTGLGLAICARLVKALGGEMHLDSQVGKGTTIRFTVRLDRLPDAAAEPAASLSHAGQRALVLMSHESAARSLTAQLEQLGVRVSSGISPTEASIAVVRSRSSDHPYDYLFIDAAMPAPGGLALVEEWQQAGCPERLVMLLEPDFTQEERQHLRSFGADTHLVKPLGPGELREAIAQADRRPVDAGFELDAVNLQALDAPAAAVLKILVVDDSPVQQDMISRLLQGHQLTVANHGAEAIEHFERERFDVILMDAQMPVMNGMAAIEAIRARELRRSWVISDDFRPSAIIALISHASVSEAERCEQAGANFVLVKPLTAEGLSAAMAKVLAPEPDPDEVTALPGTPAVAPKATRINLHAAHNDIGDLDLLGTLASMFVEDWDKYIRHISDAISQQSKVMLRQYAHELKGVSAMFHLGEVRRVCQELERKGDKTRPDWEEASLLESQLLEEMAQVRDVMENFSRTRVISH